MNISEPFIRRPVATSLLMAGIVLLGLLGYKFLPISALPTVDFPTIEVTTFFPGASADVMVSSVTTPLEKQFGQIPGLASMNSTSSFGTSTITMQFVLDRPIDVAAQDVQAAINVAGGYLPTDLPNPPKYNKVNPADTPILTLAITSDSLPLDKVNDFADTLLAQKLSEITGVGLVTIEGNQKPAVRVQVNPAAISNLGLSMEDVRTVLGQANVNAPKGSFDGAHQSFTIGSNDQIFSADAYKPIIVAYKNGAPIRLGDLANVIDSVEHDQLGAWVSNKEREEPAVLLDIQRQPGANIIQTVDRLKQILPKLTNTLPPSVHVTILADRTETIRASVTDVQFTLILTIALVVLVMFLFLRKLWATVIPSVALPLSLIGTFGIMYLAGFSLDNLSLMALTISTGFVVDDAIVMIENIVRFIEAGDPPFEAALKGARQIGFTVVSLSISLIAVFIPLLFMTGIVGRLFREFAITMSVAVAVSAVISLTLTPMMCAKLLSSEKEEEKKHAAGSFYQRTEDYFTAFRNLYERGLRWVMAHQRFTLMVAVITLVATIFLYIVIPKGLLPQQDTGVIVGVVDAAENISFDAMMKRVHAISDIVRKDPDVTSVSASVGAGTVNATLNTARLFIVLKPHDQRAGVDDIMSRLRSATTGAEGVSLFMQASQDLQIDTRVSRTQYQYILQDADAAELGQWTPKLVQKLGQIPQLTDVASDQQVNGLQVNINVDRAGSFTPERRDTGNRRHALRRLRTTAGLDYFHAIKSVPRHSRSGAGFQDVPRCSEQNLRQIDLRSASATQRIRHHDDREYSAFDPSPGPISGGNDLVQFEAGEVAERRHPRNRKGRAGNWIARQHCDDLQRRSCGIPFQSNERAIPHSCGYRRHLHRPWRSLRELHPSDHDFVDTAKRGRRSTDRPDPLPD